MVKQSFSKYSPMGTASDSQIGQLLFSIDLLGQCALVPTCEVTVRQINLESYIQMWQDSASNVFKALC